MFFIYSSTMFKRRENTSENRNKCHKKSIMKRAKTVKTKSKTIQQEWLQDQTAGSL